MNLNEQILRLSNLYGVSGWEDEVADEIAAQASAAGHAVRRDAMGNVIVTVRGESEPEEPILLAAHMDEAGLMIRRAVKDGFLKFDLVGEFDRRVLIGKHVRVGEQHLPGVIGIKPIHLTSDEERKKTPKTDTLYIDFGAESKEEAEKLVHPGDVAAFARKSGPFGSGLLRGTAFDSRVPCAVLLQLVCEEVQPVSFTAAFTVQHHVECRGAFGAGFSVHSAVAISLEGAGAADVPGMDVDTPKLSGGPVLPAQGDHTLYDRRLRKSLIAACEAENIGWQWADRLSGDGGSLQRIREGQRVMAVGIPVRYPDTPAGITDPKDSEAALRMLRRWLNDCARR